MLVLNKVDAVDKPRLLALARGAARKTGRLRAGVHDLGAERRRRDDLAAHLATTLPPGPWLYPEDQLSDMPARLLAAEITREKLFWQLQQELPYSDRGRDRELDRP